MKKVLLLSAALFLGLSSFAQMRTTNKEVLVGKADLRKVMQGKEISASAPYNFQATTPMTSTLNRWGNMEEFQTMTTSYDLQSNGYTANRLVQWADGSIAASGTLSLTYDATASDRGTGYNITLGGDFGNWGPEPTVRIESEKTGWPSMAQYGANGEIVVSHTGNGLVYYIRETKGEGEWVRGEVPNPNVGASAQLLTWARVITSGPNKDIIHIVAADQDDATLDSYIYYARSEDGGATWDVGYFPGMEGDEAGVYSADYYALASKGDIVACLFTGSVTGNTYIMKSEDNGLTWEKKMIWENPYYGFDWETDPQSIFTDTLYAPETGALTIDNQGVVHVALSAKEFIHDELGTSYSFYYGMTVDGIMYWNDTQGVMESPDGNPHHVFRLWWPSEESGYIVHGDNENLFCGWLPADETGSYNAWSNDAFFYSDYYGYFCGCSALPAIAVDDNGNLAVAYSAPNMTRLSGDGYYFRNVYVSYKSCDEDVWMLYEDNLMEDFMHSLSEGIGVVAIPQAKNLGEFVFGYMEDDFPGFAVGNYASQAQFTDNKLQVVRLVSEYTSVSEETINPLTSVYPNPATEVIYVNSAMNTDAVVTFHNIAGQVVKTVNKSLTTGENGISVNDLSTGVYFCTINANGYSKTTKVIVK